MNRKFPGRWIFFSVSLFLSNHFGFQVRASYGQSISDLEMRSLAIYVGPALCNDWSLAWPASSQWFFFGDFHWTTEAPFHGQRRGNSLVRRHGNAKPGRDYVRPSDLRRNRRRPNCAGIPLNFMLPSFYRVLPGFYRVLPGFTGFYWV